MAEDKKKKPATKKPAKKVASRKPKASPAKGKLDALGIDALCAMIIDGITMTDAANRLDVSIGTLISWIEGDVERSARAREARVKSARIWDEKATQAIEDASDQFELSKAKELAHHYRWRAAKIAPRDYGDKVQTEVTGADGGPIEQSITVSFVKPK